MVRKGHRKLSTKTVRGMCSWAHHRFGIVITAKAEVIKGCQVILCDEAYTGSRTCGKC
eukprot:Pgem_evm1s10881